jgi:predicted secreted protein
MHARIMTFGLLLAAAASAHAGDTSQLEFLGFSPDLRYCGFEVHGVLDGSGFPYSTVYLVDVDANDYAAAPFAFVGRDGETEEEVRDKAAGLARSLKEKLGVDGSNTGTLVEAGSAGRLRLDLSGGGAKASLRLTERPTDKTSDEGLEEKMFELDLLAGGKTVVLQKDRTLPKGRSGAYRYSIARAYVNGGKVAAFLEYERPGFEGPDVRQMIVTGVLPR